MECCAIISVRCHWPWSALACDYTQASCFCACASYFCEENVTHKRRGSGPGNDRDICKSHYPHNRMMTLNNVTRLACCLWTWSLPVPIRHKLCTRTNGDAWTVRAILKQHPTSKDCYSCHTEGFHLRQKAIISPSQLQWSMFPLHSYTCHTVFFHRKHRKGHL